ncbi:MAG TPA: sodium-translocating pyrophosphatase [Clostridiaceae bacterium]|nr:sodium-translocating pyrophosphatase [Clostridiaceae bacterium]
MLGFVAFAAIAALGLASINFYKVKRLDPGTKAMIEVSEAIKDGADTFIRHEYKVIAIVVAVVTVLLSSIVSWHAGAAFVLGAVMSGTAGWIGMKIATIANVRVANKARQTGNLGETLKVAYVGGSVMGLSVGGFALLGLVIVYFLFGGILGELDQANLAIKANWIGITFIPFSMTVSSYALGCSIIAMFNRVGGGIYTKAADMGADLVGKTEAHIPEDDPRNPATIADNVGDNVGDVAGLGSDLLESYVGALVSSVILALYMFYTNIHSAVGTISFDFISKLMIYPLAFAGIGILACMLGVAFIALTKPKSDPHKELNQSTQIAALLTIAGSGIFTWFFLKNQDFSSMGFNVGVLSPWIAAVIGNIAGILIGRLAELYTSYDYKPTLKVSQASEEGTALNITQGMAVGMKSVFFPMLVMAVAMIGANAVAGLYGVAMAAVGMLSYVVATVSVDTFGPIADNAGGISEMTHLDPGVRGITDKLDAVGNTTAAMGKGFAIGSAALASLSLFSSFLYAQADAADTSGFLLSLNLIDTLTMTGALVGAALPFLFSGILIESVSKAARKMVQEVRRQFRDMPGILSGDEKPDYTTCIKISSKSALREMVLPALLSVVTPLIGGFVFGPNFVAGMLIGTTLSAVALALYTANAGGSWDNAKKHIEDGYYGGKGSDAHSASVVGDTVGDPLKDTVGPSLDILIKIMSVVSILAVPVFQEYQLIEWIKSLF